ncbi:hypothetical protein QAD02_021868 [Eretmocerus hayati]|uniref:Uncharacterized protein n=1 Tax=Eretmocerus hayati TaxID=131215 RepID=A0ACC2PTX3_9HYME|nr:hypothetical protein QAD02_021868 [Eretmocerus hayati]
MAGHAPEVGDQSSDAGAGADGCGRSGLETQTNPKKRGRAPNNGEGSAPGNRIPKGQLFGIEEYLMKTRKSETSAFAKSIKTQHSPVKGSVAASASITEERVENRATVIIGHPCASDPADGRTHQEGETAVTLFHLEQL